MKIDSEKLDECYSKSDLWLGFCKEFVAGFWKPVELLPRETLDCFKQSLSVKDHSATGVDSKGLAHEASEGNKDSNRIGLETISVTFQKRTWLHYSHILGN